ncbi:G-protein coupled receptor, partial [Clarias magur]
DLIGTLEKCLFKVDGIYIKALLRAAIAAALLFWRRLNIKHGGHWGLGLAK